MIWSLVLELDGILDGSIMRKMIQKNMRIEIESGVFDG